MSDKNNVFPDKVDGLHARVFGTMTEAAVFASMMRRINISYRMKIITPPKRLKQRPTIAVMLVPRA